MTASTQLDLSMAGHLAKFASPATLAWHLTQGQQQPYRLLPHSVAIALAVAETRLGRRDRQMIFVPPQYGKSLTATIWGSVWSMALFPHENIGIASYGQALATDFGRAIRNTINQHSGELGVSISDDSAAASQWRTSAGGMLEAAGVDGPFTGKGFHCIFVDDPIKGPEEAASATIREKVHRWFMDVARTRRRHGDAGKGKMILIQTRWHEDDLAGRLLRQMEEGGEQWHVLSLPALAEADDPLGRPEGEALWPEKETRDDLLLTRQPSVMGEYAFNALYQQRPSSPEGNRIRREWWRHWTELPAVFDEMLQSWDFALTDDEGSDYTVGQVWGRVGAQFFLVDQIRGRMSTVEAISAFRNLSAMYPDCNQKLVEKAAMGPAVKSLLQAQLPGINLVKAVGSKDTRVFIAADRCAPLIEAGNVYLPPLARYPWVAEYIEEHAEFPRGAHDDMVDATSQALAHLSRGAHGAIHRAHVEAIEDGRPPLNVQEQFRKDLAARIEASIPKPKTGVVNPYVRRR